MPKPHERLSEAMRRRGIQLGKRWVHIAREADITTSALGAIRRGEYRPSPHTSAALETALQWPPGAVDQILDGGDPPDEPTPGDPMGETEAILDDSERIAAELRDMTARDRATVLAVIQTLKQHAESPGQGDTPAR